MFTVALVTHQEVALPLQVKVTLVTTGVADDFSMTLTPCLWITAVTPAGMVRVLMNRACPEFASLALNAARIWLAFRVKFRPRARVRREFTVAGLVITGL
jgi:hypothetical protein